MEEPRAEERRHFCHKAECAITLICSRRSPLIVQLIEYFHLGRGRRTMAKTSLLVLLVQLFLLFIYGECAIWFERNSSSSSSKLSQVSRWIRKNPLVERMVAERVGKKAHAPEINGIPAAKSVVTASSPGTRDRQQSIFFAKIQSVRAKNRLSPVQKCRPTCSEDRCGN